MERRTVRDTIVSDFDFDRDLTVIIDELNDVLQENKDKYSNISIERQTWDDNGSFDIEGVRDESDEEYERRLTFQASAEARTRERELQTLAELKAKYEGGKS